MVKLTGRLSAAAALCRRGVIVCDVGTDHALLACYLAQNGAKEVIASDVKEGPLSAARRTIAEQGVTNVTAVLSDGLERIDYADDVVICGMGGELIMKIISGCRFLSEDTRFILQPMTKADTLRRELYRGGFDIIEERAVREGDRFYTVMLARYTGAAQAGRALLSVRQDNRSRHAPPYSGKAVEKRGGNGSFRSKRRAGSAPARACGADMRQSAEIHTLTEEHNGGNSRSGAGVP